MESPVHYHNVVHYLWSIATFEYVFQLKKSHPVMFVLFLPLIIPGCLFTTMIASLVVLKAVSVLSTCGIYLLMFTLPLMLRLSGHLVLVIAFVCLCYFLYKAVRYICGIFEFESWTARTLFIHIIRLIYQECCIVLCICGLAMYAMLCIMLCYLPSMLELAGWLCLEVMKKVIALLLLAYDQWCSWESENSEQFCCCKTMDVFPISPEEEREILESQRRKTSEVNKKAEEKSNDKTRHVEPCPEASQKTISKDQVESIRRSILTTNLTKENVKEIWLKKQQSKRGRRRWSRMSNNALSVSVSPVSKEW